MDTKRRNHIIVITLIILIVIFGAGVALCLREDSKAKAEKPDSELVAEANQGKEAYKAGNLVRSFYCYSDFIHKAEQHKELYGQNLVDAYFYTALVYAYYYDTPNSLKNNLKAYNTAIKTNDSGLMISILTNIADNYIEIGNYAKANEYNNKLLEFKNLNREGVLCCYYGTRGEIKAKTHKGGSPLDDWKQAYSIVENTKNIDVKSSILYDIASYYGYLKDYRLELEYLEKSFDVAQKANGLPQVQMAAARNMLDYYIKTGDAKNTLKFSKMYLSLLDSSMNAKKFIEAKNAQEQYEQQKAEKSIQSLNITISKHRLITIIAIAAFFVAVIVLSLIIYKDRKLREAYRALYRMNVEVMAKNNNAGKPNPSKSKPRTDGDDQTATMQQSDELYERILKLMETPATYCDPEFSLMKLATLLGTNITYVSKVINEHYGQNVPTFINSYRIAEARRKISDTATYGHLTLQAIAQSVGYSTQVNFNRAFKQITGMTPSVFQKMAKENTKQE